MASFKWLFSLFRKGGDEVFTINQTDRPILLEPLLTDIPPSPEVGEHGVESPMILGAAARRSGHDHRRPPEDVWEEIRQQVFRSDGMRCQVTGCINQGVGLECHHIKSVAKGGSHELKNLVTLCLFHHACQEDHDVRSMKKRADTDRFCIKPPYWRLGRRIGCSIIRKSLVTVNDLKRARQLFDLRCSCGSSEWTGFLRPRFNDLVVLCPVCMNGWWLPLGVREETCVALAHALQPQINLGRFGIQNFSADMVGLRLNARPIQACPDCFGEDKRCGYLVPQRRFGRHWTQCINVSVPKIGCHVRNYR